MKRQHRKPVVAEPRKAPVCGVHYAHGMGGDHYCARKPGHAGPHLPEPLVPEAVPTKLARAALCAIAALKPSVKEAPDHKALAELCVEIARQALAEQPCDARDRLTIEQKRRYFENGTLLCPFCESPDISGQHIEVESQFAWQEVTCAACGAEWQDLYTQHDVDSIDYERKRKGEARVAS